MAGKHFAIVDQACNQMKKLEQYIDAGMDTTLSVTTDLLECEKDVNRDQLEEFKQTMLAYARMARERDQFLKAVQYVKTQARGAADEQIDLLALLDQKLDELESANNEDDLSGHAKYEELNHKIDDLTAQEEAVPEMLSVTLGDEDLAISQAELNVKCPYTGQDMKDPVKNKLCGHHYEKQGVYELIKARKGKAKCPVAGCKNDKAVQMDHVVEDVEFRRYIQQLHKQNKHPARRGKNVKKEQSHDTTL